jgi:hemoglobin
MRASTTSGRAVADGRSATQRHPLVDEAHHKVPPAGFKYLVTEMLCWAAGGLQKYTGKDMKSSHQDLRITPGEWDAFMDDVAQTLEKFAVPAAEQTEITAIVASTRGPARMEESGRPRRNSSTDQGGRKRQAGNLKSKVGLASAVLAYRS